MPVATGSNTGSYVFVVEALSESDLSSETGDRSARDGRKTASVTFEYVIENADEAPWNVRFGDSTATGIGTDNIAEDGAPEKVVAGEPTFDNDYVDEDGDLRTLTRLPHPAEKQKADFSILRVTYNGQQLDE